MIRFCFLLLCSLIILSCDQPALVEVEKENADGFWSQEDVISIDFEIDDTTKVYDLTLTVDHTTDYRWQNLYIKVSNLFPNGDTLSKAVSLDLADNKGQWQGDCSGPHCSAIVDLQSSFYFPIKGKYEIWIEQFMRETNLEGIERIHLGLYSRMED